MIEHDGDVMTRVVPDAKAKTLIPLVTENVEKGHGYGGIRNIGTIA